MADRERLTWSDSDDLSALRTPKKRKRTKSPTPAAPSYLVERRLRFDEGVKGGLDRLLKPPDYSDIPELQDDAADPKQLRPQLAKSVKFVRPEHDIFLKKSLGTIPFAHARYMRQYQVDGISMMHEKFVYQKGMILGDDMGLGKTIQVIGFLTAAFGKTADKRDSYRMRALRKRERWYPRVLILCPSSLIDNWIRELNKWGYWIVESFHGLQKMSILDTAKQGRLEIMVTTYRTYQIHESEINLIEWDCVVADECHSFKESDSDLTRTMGNVNALCRIGLTGTAIQNSYEDMWCLLNWPGELGSKTTWSKTISRPLKAGQSHAATWDELRIARTTAAQLVNNVLPRFFLRRTKALIADQLPKKRDLVVFCPMTPLQTEAYGNYMEPSDSTRFEKSCQTCHCANPKKPDPSCQPCQIKQDDNFFRKCATGLQLANHLAYIIPSTVEEKDRAMRVLKTCLPDSWQHYSKREPVINYSDPELCGKWKIIQKMLKIWKQEGDKVLIFSYSTRLLDMLTYLLSSDENAYTYCRLDGTMKLEERQREVDKFNDDPDQFIFLLSIKAGGLGLNITSANRVVIWDPNWNPTYDLQAQDRSFRLGQVRDVVVYRLVSAGTIEEIVYARQIYKQQQANIGYSASNERRYFDGVMGETDKKGEIFGKRNMFAYKKDDVKWKAIANKTNVAEALMAHTRVEELDTNNLVQTGPQLPDGLKEQLPDSTTTPTDPITAILNQVGVQYVHDNSEVIGSSKVEDQISRQALTEKSHDRPFGTSAAVEDVIFRPPKDICRRQFNSMAKYFKFKSPTVFALHVENMTQEQRRNMLERFYAALSE